MKTRNNTTINKRKKAGNLCLIISALGLILFFSSCEDFIEIGTPSSETLSETVFTDDVLAESAIRGIYIEMSNTGFASGGRRSVTYLSGLSADSYIVSSNPNTDVNKVQFEENELTSNNFELFNLWSSMYEIIFLTNAAIEGLENSTGVTDELKNQLLAESKFIRAFSYFYLINLFGDVPLILMPDFQENKLVPRNSMSEVYTQIINDLESAEEFLAEDYSFSNNERVRPNKAAAKALLARVYLFLEDWSKAEEKASEVIANQTYLLESDLNEVFLANSDETIWQIFPVSTYLNTNEGSTYINFSLNGSLADAFIHSFEDGDKRLANWTASTIVGGTSVYYPFKYKIQFGTPGTEYSMVLRLAEQYLIRAEARARLGQLNEAIDDLDMIRYRAGLPLISNTNPLINQADLLLAIEQERRVELFTEWGHRWLDLKRTGRVDGVLESLKEGWQATDVLYPIPAQDLERNPNLTQNPGY